jgi:hypothetical protein
MLASFIVASISYVADMIPETTIHIEQQQQNPYLYYYTPIYYNNTNLQSLYNITINTTGRAGRPFIVYSTARLNPPARPQKVTVSASDGQYSPVIYTYNETTYYSIGSIHPVTIYRIGITLNTTATGYLDFYIFIANNITEALTGGSPASALSISNKLIINFIGWVAGIMIVLEALRRFDLEI